MSTQALKEAATGGSVAQRQAGSFPALLEQHKKQIALALPKHMNADRMARVALTEFRKNPALGKCDPLSVFASIITLSQLGLEPGVMGQAYLVPYKENCTPVPGWQGLVDLVSRAGRASVWTGAIYVGDEFDYAYGSDPFIKHIPGDADQDPERLTHVYAVGKVRGSEERVIEVWPIQKIARHRDRFNKVGNRHYSFSNPHNFEMYARKIPLLQVIKYLPKSVEVARAFDMENAAQAGQTIDLKEAIDGTWTAPDPEQQPQQRTQATPAGDAPRDDGFDAEQSRKLDAEVASREAGNQKL